MRSARGYTLAELLVVLVILGIVAAGVAPAIRAVQRDPLDVAADEVARVVFLARNAALQAGASVRLTVNPATRQFLIERLDDSTSLPLEQGALSLASGVTIAPAGSPLRMTFARTGFAPPDSLALQSPAGTRLIRIDGWTGRPAVERGSETLR